MSIELAATGASGSHGPAVKVSAPFGLYYLSGINANPVYVGQPMTGDEEKLPAGIREQSALTLTHLEEVLAVNGMSWGNVAKIILYVTDIREAPAVRGAVTERFGSEWTPAFTTVQVDNLVARGARVQLDVIAGGPTG